MLHPLGERLSVVGSWEFLQANLQEWRVIMLDPLGERLSVVGSWEFLQGSLQE
jgi:hypothetical protein